jgi:hypothetical protein
MEYVLTIVILALLVERFISNRQVIKERNDLIRGVLSKDAIEFKASEDKPTEEYREEEPPYTPIEELSDDEFFKKINGTEDK